MGKYSRRDTPEQPADADKTPQLNKQALAGWASCGVYRTPLTLLLAAGSGAPSFEERLAERLSRPRRLSDNFASCPLCVPADFRKFEGGGVSSRRRGLGECGERPP